MNDTGTGTVVESDAKTKERQTLAIFLGRFLIVCLMEHLSLVAPRGKLVLGGLAVCRHPENASLWIYGQCR